MSGMCSSRMATRTMPYANKADLKAYIARKKTRARLLVANIRMATCCVRCGSQPIDWHHEAHKQKAFRRVSSMAAGGDSNAAIEAEIAASEALCRRCHMQADG